MDMERPPNLRTAGKAGAAPPGGARLGGTPPINALAELVADLLSATDLVPADKLAVVRGAAGQGSLSHALVEHGLATSQGIALTVAARYQMPLVDLPLVGVDENAAKQIPLHVLERVVAIPYALVDDTLRIAVADPGNVNAIDELRIATRHQVELAGAAKDDSVTEISRHVRASEAFGARAAVEEELALEEAEEDGASDVHFEPQDDALLVRFRVDGVLQEVQRIPKRMMAGVLTRLKVLAKLDIAERRKPQDGRISLNAAAAGRLLDIRVAT